ncbi:MAG: glycosyltransferase family 2 protein [Vicinamibacterales bacterium]
MSDDGLTLSVVIPALNEEDGIADIVYRVLGTRDALRAVGVTGLEVIVVDDGSEDGTARIVEQIDGAQLVRHPHNIGYGAAIKTGFGRARGELLAFLDADSTYPPEYFAQLCDRLVRDEADIAIGSRRSGAESHMPPVRRLGNLIWSSLLTVIGNTRVQDPASGMRVMKRECLRLLYPLPDGLNFTPVMSTRSLHEGLRVAEIPITYRERSGRSKLSVVRDGTRFLQTILWTALEYNPARIMELVGLGAFALAGLIGVLLVAARMQGVTNLGPWGVFALYSGLILAVGGVSLFSLGTSFNRLVALFHRRPIKQAQLVTRLLGPLPERYFGWIGLAFSTVGAVLGVSSLVLGLNGWEITRLWLWLLGSALFVLVGVQLMLFWMLIEVLDAIDARDEHIGAELTRAERAAAMPLPQPALGGTRPQ